MFGERQTEYVNEWTLQKRNLNETRVLHQMRVKRVHTGFLSNARKQYLLKLGKHTGRAGGHRDELTHGIHCSCDKHRLRYSFRGLHATR